VPQDYLFATTGYHLQLVVADKWNASRLLAAFDVDASLYDVTVVTDLDIPEHGRQASTRYDTCILTYIHTNLYSAKIVKTNLWRWHWMTRRYRQTGRDGILGGV